MRLASHRTVALLRRALSGSAAAELDGAPGWPALARIARDVCAGPQGAPATPAHRRERARALAARALALPEVAAAAAGKDLPALWHHVASAVLPSWMPAVALRAEVGEPGHARLWVELRSAEELRSDAIDDLFEVLAAFAERVPALATGEPAIAAVARWPDCARARIDVAPAHAAPAPVGASAELAAELGALEDGIVELTADGRVLFVNDRAAEAMGYPASHFVGRALEEVVAQGDRDRVLDEVSALRAPGASATIEFRAIDADGVPHDLEARATAFESASGARRIGALIRSVTSRVEREAVARREAEALREAAGTGYDIAFETDGDGDTLSVLAVGADFAAIPRDARFAQHLFQRALDSHAPLAADAWLAAREGRGPAELDIQLRTDDGGLRWYAAVLRPFSERGRVARVAVRLKDITRRKEYEDALRAVAETAFDGGPFLESLVGHVARAMDVECALVAVARDDGAAEAVALWADGALGDELSFPVAGSPFETLLAGSACCYSVGVARRFAQLPAFPGGPFASFVGAPLRDDDGGVIGCLAALGRRPIANADLARSTLAIFAQRAAAELRRAAAARALRESEARLRAILEQSPDLIVDADAEHGITYVSPAVQRTLGISPRPGELVARLDPADRARALARLREAYDRPEPVNALLRIRDRDDHWHWIDVTARGYRSQSGRRRAVLLGRDVTDRRLAERERRQLTALMEHGSDLMALASLEGEILYVNTAGRELLGVAEGEAPARLDGFFAGADGTPEPALRARIEPVLARSGRWAGHLTLLPRTGAAPIPVLASFVLLSDELPGHGAAIALVCRDEREVLETRHAFREAARRLDLIERGAHYVIAELDRDGRIVYASPNSARVIGLERDALLGRDAFELLPDDARATARVVFERVLAQGAAELGRTSCIDGEGRRRPVEAAIAPATDIDGRPRAVLVVRDLSAEERTAQQLRESEEHLRQAQKMEAVGQLAGGIAHDFNNLLTAITGHADLLLGDLGDDHPSAQDAREVLHAANRAAGLTRQLLAFSRRQVLESRPVDLNALVSQLDRMLRRVVGEHYAFVTQLDGSLWPVVADPGQLEQVLLNLVVNARDAMPGGGAITIRTENLTIANALETCAGDAPPGDYATLCVVDQGTGIEPETAARIFEPFFTTKRPGEGTGLGLSTVLGIVEQSGGHLVLDSAPGLGACFTILLPRATAEVAEPEAAVPTVAERGEGTVLVIEDEAAVRALLVRHLSEHGYDVIEATDGDGALELCRRAARVDLVLSDVVLPSYDGPTIAERVREAFPGAAIAYISGFPDAALERRGLAAADVDLLAKPFSRADLLAFVDRVLAAHRARAAAPKEPLKPA